MPSFGVQAATGTFICAMDNPSFGINPTGRTINVKVTEYDFTRTLDMSGWALTSNGTKSIYATVNGTKDPLTVSCRGNARNDVYTNDVCIPYRNSYKNNIGMIGWAISINLSRLDKSRTNCVDVYVTDTSNRTYKIASITIEKPLTNMNRVSFVKFARREVGFKDTYYKQGDIYLSKFIDWYHAKGTVWLNNGRYTPGQKDYCSWCAMFVTYCAKLTGIQLSSKIDSFWNKNVMSCCCNDLMYQCSKNNCKVAKNDYSNIKPGMLVFLRGAGGTSYVPGHIGIVSETVYKADTNQLNIRYVHGNTSGTNAAYRIVKEQPYTLVNNLDPASSNYVIAYGNPFN